MVDRYIPQGAIKVADKKSDAVAYLYQSGSKPAYKVFYGKQSKAVAWFLAKDEAQRAEQVAKLFASRQASIAFKAEQRAKFKAKPRALQAGGFYYTSWGYEQTNIDWYMVVELVGKASAKVVKVKSMDFSKGDEGWAQGKSMPSQEPVGEPFMVRANGDGFKVDGRYNAYAWDGQPKNWTAYA